MLVEVLTDNRKRAVAEVRNVFSRSGGNLAEAGAVAWMFQQRGIVTVEAGGSDPDEVGLWAIDAGAEDIRVDGQLVEVYTEPSQLETIRGSLAEQKVNVTGAEVAMIPTSTLPLDAQHAASTLRLMERLEDLDDVQKVYTNLEITDEALAAYGSSDR